MQTLVCILLDCLTLLQECMQVVFYNENNKKMLYRRSFRERGITDPSPWQGPQSHLPHTCMGKAMLRKGGPTLLRPRGQLVADIGPEPQCPAHRGEGGPAKSEKGTPGGLPDEMHSLLFI